MRPLRLHYLKALLSTNLYLQESYLLASEDHR